jgi:hypothetical protein
MAGGYFSDAETSIELGEHVAAEPADARLNLALPGPRAARFLAAGGGVCELQLTAGRLRANLGDAECYAYNLLESLAASGAGELALEDERGRRQVFGQAVCVGGSARVRALRYVQIQAEFLCPERESQPSWAAIPSPPATYPGTSTAQDYAIQQGGAEPIPLGLGGAMAMEMARDYEPTELPRLRGARSSAPPHSAHIRLTVTAARACGAAHAASDLDDLARAVGPAEITLLANGVAYDSLLLDRVDARPAGARHCLVEFGFLKELKEV